ncbi:MAG TPA: carboxypeptidase regulatory-like domain-containing protein [Candidatus Acidoferrales bacterium]|nr:carboxypeptidase regulatory-like domain-containing protein [Candidatus Acidoferrales bacterium]
MKRAFLFVVSLFIALPAFATVFGTVRGIVHDPQHRPVQDVTVTLKAKTSSYVQTAQTDPNGEFHFDAVPLGEYRVTASAASFSPEEQSIAVLSGTAPILHFELKLGSQTESIIVSADAGTAQLESITPTTLVNRLEISDTPGASRTNSLALITDYVPGSYVVHDQLHVRGGHQVTWLIDGVAIPNTNIASNLGPQVDPKDIDTMEAQRGSYSADYGDRTYGIFNVAPRTGFERDNEAELVLSGGNFYQTDDQFNFGGHTNRFAYYASVNGNRTNLGLQTPTSAVIHDAANGFGGFTSLIYNADSQDQLRLVAQLRRDFFQVPFDPNDPGTQGQFLRDANRENDSFVTFSWVRTFSPGLMLTISPFYHYNSANYQSTLQDFPSSATEDRSSKYEGGQATLSWIKNRSNLRVGLYGFSQQDGQLFGLICHDPSQCESVDPPERHSPDGSLAAVYAEEQFKATSWLTLNGGFRQTHFSGGVVENASSPRVGASLRIPKLHWVFRAFYGHFYQAPPLLTVSGPLLQAANNQNLTFIPLHGERDEEHQFGVTIPFHGWTLDASNFLTRAENFFDHNNFNNSDLFFPITIQGARINGWELTLRSPRVRNRAQVYLTYSNQLALGFGDINGGLTNFSFGDGFKFLDHDQRNTLHLGGQYTLPWRAYASTDVYYASGFSNGSPPPSHLQSHTTFDLSLGKSFGERFSANLQAINVANRRVLLDNSFTFGGTHYLNPRELYVQVRYRFHL